MEVCKNKLSNKYFIFIQNTGNAEMLLVTPEAQVKSLKRDLFGEFEEIEEIYLLENELVTQAQVQRFNDYNNSRSDEIIEQIEELSPFDKKRLLQKLQKMIGDK